MMRLSRSATGFWMENEESHRERGGDSARAHRRREHGRVTAAGDSDDAAVPFGDRLAKEERSEHRHQRERQHERSDQREHDRQRHWTEKLDLDAPQAEDR